MSELALCDHSSPEGHRLAGFCFSRVQFLLRSIGRKMLPGCLGLHPGLVQRGVGGPGQDALRLFAQMRFFLIELLGRC